MVAINSLALGIFAILPLVFAQPTATRGPVACPTITKVENDCSTCMQAMCMAETTIRNPCGCPTAVPTVTVTRDCDDGCVGGCEATIYNVKQARRCSARATSTLKSASASATATGLSQPLAKQVKQGGKKNKKQ